MLMRLMLVAVAASAMFVHTPQAHAAGGARAARPNALGRLMELERRKNEWLRQQFRR